MTAFDQIVVDLREGGTAVAVDTDGAEAICPSCLDSTIRVTVAPDGASAAIACRAGCERDSIVDAIESRRRQRQTSESVAPRYAPATDLDNAEAFAFYEGEALRYVAERRKWIAYRDGRWRSDVTGDAQRAAKRFVRRLLHDAGNVADDRARQRAASWAARSQAAPRITALLELAASDADIAVTENQLDAHPFLLSVGNGTVDLETGRLLSALPDDLLTRGTDVPYDINATCPRWEQFLSEVCGGDVELIGFLHRLVGYSLTGDTREHVLAVLHGGGCNGKSVFLETIKRVLGDLATTAAFDTFSATRDQGPRNDLARLRGARLVTASESGEGRRLDEATVKEITGGDTIAARFLYGEHFEFKPTFKVLLVTNHRPDVSGDDDGIWRRLRLVPFEQTFLGREDRTLTAKLEAELPGILRWAVRGCLLWQRDGLGGAEAVTAATNEYREEEDTLGAFLAEQCSAEGETPAKLLRSAYEAWCGELGERPLSGSALGKRLTRRGVQVRRGAQGARTYVGISIQVTGRCQVTDGDGAFNNSPNPPAREQVCESSVTTRHRLNGDLTETRIPEPNHGPVTEHADRHPDAVQVTGALQEAA